MPVNQSDVPEYIWQYHWSRGHKLLDWRPSGGYLKGYTVCETLAGHRYKYYWEYSELLGRWNMERNDRL